MSQELSEMSKNDLDNIDKMMSGEDAICSECGMRLRLFGSGFPMGWSTCQKWDESYTCWHCIEADPVDQWRKNTSGWTPGSVRCPFHAKGAHPKTLKYKDKGMQLGYVNGVYAKVVKEKNECIDCRIWKQRAPYDYAWQMWEDPMRQTHWRVRNKLRYLKSLKRFYSKAEEDRFFKFPPRPSLWCRICLKETKDPFDLDFFLGIGNACHPDETGRDCSTIEMEGECSTYYLECDCDQPKRIHPDGYEVCTGCRITQVAYADRQRAEEEQRLRWMK